MSEIQKNAKPGSLIAIRDALGYTSNTQFSREWKELPERDRDQIRAGVENGTLTY